MKGINSTKNSSKLIKITLGIFLTLFILFISSPFSFASNNRELLQVHFIDVGQADSILIHTPTGETMLIDGGNRGDSDLVIDYLHKQGIHKIDVLIGTHPHEDHIGGLQGVIENFDIGTIYMPKVVHTSKTYEDLLLTIKKNGYKINHPISGTTFELGTAVCEILAPNSDTYDSLNDYSIVLRLSYDANSFLFTGDAENLSEKEILKKNYDIDSDVLKVAHHGSRYSSSEEFLHRVSPKYAVIMTGIDNSYGHPHEEVLRLLQKDNVPIYRTDESGTIVMTSDGDTITIESEDNATFFSLLFEILDWILEIFES